MTSSNRQAAKICLLFSFACLFLCSSAVAVDHIEIGDNRSNNYLPFGLDTITSETPPPYRAQVRYPMRTYLPGIRDSVSGYYMTSTNPAFGAEPTADLTVRTARLKEFFLEKPLHFTVYDFALYHSICTTFPGILVGGYRHDSSFVARIRTCDSTVLYIPICSGVDADDNGEWRGLPGVVGCFDYNHDGRDEAFFWIDASRDYVPRLLVCIDPDAGSIEWQVPVAPGILPGQLLPCGDSTNPGIIFSAYGMGQSVTDSLFSSNHGYVATVDRNGRVNRRRAAGFAHAVGIAGLPGDSLFVLTHTLPLTDTRFATDSQVPANYVSLIDRHLNVRKSVELPLPLNHPWLSDYNGDGTVDIYTLTTDGTIRIYDQELSLLAQSSTSSLGLYVTSFPSYGTYENVFVFTTPRGDEVYSHDFKKLAALGSHEYYAPFEFDKQGRMTAFVGSDNNHELIATIVRRSLVDLISTFYVVNQIWILSSLFGLAAGLVVMNFYRSRVSRQRTQIAHAHKELAETHEALKQAQATIIAQEKYKQAKDMAGAFAHEIRNALFPADSAMTKLVQLESQSSADPERLRTLKETIRSSVTRAIGITEEISTYTKLDTLYAPEPVRVADAAAELSRSYGILLEEQGVKFESSGSPDSIVIANKGHLGAVFSNLMLNSLHALHGRDHGRITMVWRRQANQVAISFSDNGCGIPPDQIDRVFDAFFSTKATKGTGLGLATSRRIVEMYGGTISVTSNTDVSTEFTILLPAGSPGGDQPITTTHSVTEPT